MKIGSFTDSSHLDALQKLYLFEFFNFNIPIFSYICDWIFAGHLSKALDQSYQ